MINLHDEYRKNRKTLGALQAWKVAYYAVRRDFEQKLTGFSVQSKDSTNNGWINTVFYQEEEYLARVDYDEYDNIFETSDVEILNKRPYSGKYAREQVVEVSRGRDTRWILFSESPAELAKWYSKQGYSRGVAYEMGAASCMRTLAYYAKIFSEGVDSYFVSITKGNEDIDACSGILYDEIEDYIWDNIK